MNKKYFLIFYYFFIILLDQFFKLFIFKNHLASQANFGIIFGHLATVDPTIRIIFLSCFFSLILFIFGIIIFYFLINDERLNRLSTSLVFLIAGISGNAIDRIRVGYVLDYIHFPNLSNFPLVFNFSDIVQFFGLFFSLYYLFKFKNILWPTHDNRNLNLTDKNFQISFAIKLVLVSFFSILIMGIFSYSFCSIYVPDFDQNLKTTFIMFWVIITLLLSLGIFILGLILSNRIAGPIVALERFILSLKKDPQQKLVLRKTDYFKKLEQLSEKIRELLQK